MSYGVDIIAKKNQESQIQLSNLDTEHLWTTGATELTSNLTVLTGNTRSYMYKRYSPWRTEISNSLTLVFDSIYFTARYTGEYIIYRSLFDINPPASNNIKSASITISRAATGLDAGKAYLYGLTRIVSGTTSGGDWSGASVSAFSDESTYNNTTDTITFVLNTAGLLYLNSGGISFMIKSREDVLDIAPTFSGSLLLFDLISGSCVYDSTPTNLIDGLLSSVADVGTDSTLVPLTQTGANYRPQSGYDKTASYIARLSDVVVDGLNRVSSWVNSATSTTRVLASLTQSTDTLKPTFNATDETLDFYTNNYLINTMTAKSTKGLTISIYANIPEIVSITANTERVKFWGNVGSNRFILYQSAGNTLFFIPALYEGGVQKIVTGYSLSATSFNASYANNYHLYTYVIRPTLVEFYIDTTKVYTASVSFNSIDFINTTSTSVFSDLTNVFKLVSSKTYFTPISSYEVGLLYANRDNLTYELPRTGVTSNGSQFMSSLVLPVNTVINTLTVSCWVYLANVLSFATQAEQVICSTDGFTNLATDKGFQLKIQKLTGDLCRFQVQVANGTSIVTANSASLSLSAFRTAYANKWNLVALTVSTDTTNDTLTVLVNSVNLASTSATTGIYNTGTGTVLAGARSDGFNIGAGNRIEHLRIDISKAMDATELYRQMIEDKATYSYLNNS